MNLEADLDLDSMRLCEKDSPGPCVHGHFSTEQMDRFADDLASLIRSLDPSRPVSSGYSIPRPAAAHLVRKPGFASGGPDFTPDTPDEFAQYLTAVHKLFQIISIHVYPNMEPGRFGRQSGEEAKLVADAAAAARTAGRPLFLGEFGDKGATPFMTALLDEIVRSRVEYAAVWIWEFYQTSTYRTHDTEPTKYSLEPGYPNGVIPLLMRTEGELGVPPPTTTDALPRVVLTWPLPCGVIEAPVELHAVARSPAVLTGPSADQEAADALNCSSVPSSSFPSAANSRPHRLRGSPQDGGSGSFPLAGRQAQARTK